MKSYIVRIYRDEKGRAGELLGTIERPRENIKLAFTSFDELKEILSTHAGKDARAETREWQKRRKPN
jgi:hypothetical protein